MSDPWDELIAAIDAPGVNLYGAPTEVIVPPAIVVRPDDPWIVPDGFGYDTEAYAAICVAQAAAAQDGMRTLHELVHIVEQATRDLPGWSWLRTQRAVVEQASGSAYLAATVRLAYSDCSHTGGPTP